MSTEIFTYRTKDGRAYFKFSYPNANSYYEIDINLSPNYGGRNTGFHTTHRLTSSRLGVRHKICISSGHEPRSLDKAKKISMEWAELTWTYIKTGVSIDNQILQRN